MSGFSSLFKLGMKKRIKDSFLIGYGVIFPLMLIGILGYMGTNYYSGENGITSYYYYTMVSIPLCTFLLSITLIYIAKEESEAKCGERFIIAPIDKAAIVLAKILPASIVALIYNFILLVFCKMFFKVDYKGRFIEILILFGLLGVMACAIGTFIGLGSKDFMAVKNVVSTPILVMALLGGSFFPIGSLGRTVELISYISPLTWINKGIFMMLNDNNNSMFNISIILTLVISIVFTLGSIKRFKKEVFV